MFAHDRDRGKVVDLSSRRRRLKPADSLREEPTLPELEAKRRERLDAGDRTVAAMRFDGLGPDLAPRLTIRETTYIGGGLETIRAEAMDLAKVVNGKQPGELHQRLVAMVAEVEDLSVRLAEWSSDGAA